MNFTVETSISAAAVFAQGVISFFSPCVLPLLPIYLGYLSGGVRTDEEDRTKGRAKTLLNTLSFVLGVSFAIFLLGLGASVVGSFFGVNRTLLARIGGVVVILFGLYQLGVFGSSALLSREKRLPLHIDKMAMSPITAFLMGFVFSFSWTPCIGPALSSVLLMTASASSRASGFALLGLYTLGFCIPFLALGLFTTSLVQLLKKHQGIVRYTTKIGAILLIIMGALMLTGYMNSMSGYLSRITTQTESTEKPQQEVSETVETTEEQTDERTDAIPAPTFELHDQYGVIHTLEQYGGKVVFLNFWATWCPPCRSEMPDIQSLFETYGADNEEVAILSVATPGIGGEGSESEVISFLEENGYTYPVLMDSIGELLNQYGISAFPTTFMIDAEGCVYGYIPGAMDINMMQSIIQQTLQGTAQ